MKKLILKSSIITLSLVLILGALFFVIVSASKPYIIANVAFNLNNKELSVKYSEKQFIKTQDISDLSLLTERCIWANDYNKVVKYSSILLSHKDFDSYSSDYENYIASSYTEALYLTKNKLKSVEVAFSYYDGIKAPNTIRVLIYNAKNDKDTLNLILTKLNGINDKTQETNYLISEINKLL